MSKSKRRTVERILDKSKIPESLKVSFLRAYSAAHKHQRRSEKQRGGV